MRDFLRWCSQFSRFPYSQVGYWIDAYERGDGFDSYGHRIELRSDLTQVKKRK